MENNIKTYIFMIAMTLVSSLLLSYSYSALKERTEKNVQFDIKRNIVKSAGYDIDKMDKPVEWPSDTRVVEISAKTGQGLKELVSVLNAYITKRFEIGTRKNVLTRTRHREALTETLAALVRASEVAAVELFAEDLRLAARSLGRITGRVDVEDILDRIFLEFCIGK